MRIAITGKMCSGKTYISDILIKKYNLKKYSFGQKVKDIAKDLFKMEYKNRILLQTLADKMKEIDKDIWIKYILSEINSDSNIIIDDLRFENELKYLQENNFIIIRLNISEEERLNRLKIKYPNTYNEHLNGSNHNSEVNINKLNEDLDLNSDKHTLEKIINYLYNR